MAETDRTLAVFIDFENLAIGFKHRRGDFDIHKILERLVEKGKVIVKKAYADWNEYKQYTRPLHENAIELIEIPRRQMTGKNSADIRLAVDAMDLSWSKEHIDTFVVVSGDSDFSPLVSKLKENGKHVIGIGMRESTSALLVDNCDEFIFYEDLEKQTAPTAPSPQTKDIPEEKREVFDLLLESIAALIRENAAQTPVVQRVGLWVSQLQQPAAGRRKAPAHHGTPREEGWRHLRDRGICRIVVGRGGSSRLRAD
jgi:uncharacterized protein (TIGR00288 family)